MVSWFFFKFWRFSYCPMSVLPDQGKCWQRKWAQMWSSTKEPADTSYARNIWYATFSNFQLSEIFENPTTKNSRLFVFSSDFSVPFHIRLTQSDDKHSNTNSGRHRIVIHWNHENRNVEQHRYHVDEYRKLKEFFEA